VYVHIPSLLSQPSTVAGTPEDSGIALQAVRELGPEYPLFGVCMGHQCIGQVFGGERVFHAVYIPLSVRSSWLLHALIKSSRTHQAVFSLALCRRHRASTERGYAWEDIARDTHRHGCAAGSGDVRPAVVPLSARLS
jgi:hypothetical protein